MATDHSKQPKCCCLECGKEFYVIYFERHIKTCKHVNNKNKIEKVSCPICGKKLKEVNTAHLRKHNLEYEEAKKMFPDHIFISETSLSKKATLTNLTPEQSKNLKYGHTLEAKIKKYGEEEGLKRHLESKENYSYSKSLQGYIDRLGEEEGRKQWENRNEKISDTLIKFWSDPPEELKLKGTLQWYQKQYREELGKLKWLEMCNNKSKSLRKIPVDLIQEYELYRSLVYRVTRSNLKLYKNQIPLLETRGRLNHLDHMYSIYQGFMYNVSPYIIGFFKNLKILPAGENCSKQIDCSQSLEQIISEINKNLEYQNIIESDLFDIDKCFKQLLDRKTTLSDLL